MSQATPQVFDPVVAARWIATRTGLDASTVELVLDAETDYLVEVVPTLPQPRVVVSVRNDWVAQRTGLSLPFVQVVLAESLEYMVHIGLAHYEAPHPGAS